LRIAKGGSPIVKTAAILAFPSEMALPILGGDRTANRMADN
jgi:hypothetical protein